MHNEDLHTELEYLSDEYAEEREMEPRPARVRETTPVLRTVSLRVQRQKQRVIEFEDAPNRDGGREEINSEGGRPSERRAEDNMHQGVNLPPLLAAHLGRGENGQPLQSSLTSVHGGHYLSVNTRGNLPPNCTHLLHNVQPLKTISLVEFLSTDLPTTYKGMMEKTYTWIEAKEVATNDTLNDHRESFDSFKKNSSWDNNKGKNNRDVFFPYCGSNHGLLSNLSKSTWEILATEKVAKASNQPPCLFRSIRSRDMSKYCYFHKDRGHDTNQCQELKHQIEEAMKLGDDQTLKRRSMEESVKGIREITFPYVLGIHNSSNPVIIKNALQTLLPQIRAEIHKEFRTSFGPSNAGGNPLPVTIHTWLERFNKQKPHSFEKAT
nr:hypothetical protein [Tanacetum cinerariifolium]